MPMNRNLPELNLDSQTSTLAPPAQIGRGGWFYLVRLALALVLTFTVLTYAWGRWLIEGVMIRRNFNLHWLAILALGIAAVMALTNGLAARLPRNRFHRHVFGATVWIWILVNGVLVSVFAGKLMPKAALVPLFVLASLWVVWAAWMFFRPWSWTARIGGLAVCAAFAMAFPVLVDVEGLTGQLHINFAWRFWRGKDSGAELAGELSPLPEDQQI